MKILAPASKTAVSVVNDAAQEADPASDVTDWVTLLARSQFQHSLPQVATVLLYCHTPLAVLYY